MTDPWLVREKTSNQESSEKLTIDTNSNETNDETSPKQESLEFEDNFLPTHNTANASDLADSQHTPLPDSQDYLQSLEKKLKKIKQSPKILEALSEKRAECLRNLLDDNLFINKDESLELDAPFSSSDSTVQELYRHIQPVQPLSVGETVHIVKYDQLEPDVEQEQQTQEDSTSESTSHLAWKSRMTIPVLVTTVFLIMDIRLQIEINIQSGQFPQPAVELADLDDDSIDEYTTGTDYDDDDDDEDEDTNDDEAELDVLADMERSNSYNMHGNDFI